MPESGGAGNESGDPKPSSAATTKPGANQRSKPEESCDAAPRPNALAPTNGTHATERRLERPLRQGRSIVFLAGATLLGIMILEQHPFSWNRLWRSN